MARRVPSAAGSASHAGHMSRPCDARGRGSAHTDQRLLAELRRFLSPRSVLVGIGNTDRGDDGFGPAVIRALEGLTSMALIDAGVCPENYLGRIAGCRPGSVLILDAAELGARPGMLALCDPDEVIAGGVSSHAGPMGMSARYLRAVTGAPCRLLLVQPARLTMVEMEEGTPAAFSAPFGGLSPEVRQAARSVLQAIIAVEKAPSRSAAAISHVS